jgi:transcriptional regulator with XRE-family HTH domain
MSRPNRPRSIASEANLARRISFERESREWSYERLAQEMTAAGCPIQGSAIYKIEKGSPPRRVTVDELVAVAAVLDRDINDLLTPMDIIERDAAIALADDLRVALDDLQRIANQCSRCVRGLSPARQEQRRTREYVQHRVFRTGEVRAEPDDGDPDPPGSDVLIRGIVKFQQAIVRAAEMRAKAMLDPGSPDHIYAQAAQAGTALSTATRKTTNGEHREAPGRPVSSPVSRPVRQGVCPTLRPQGRRSEVAR